MDDVFGDTFAEKPTPGQQVAQEQTTEVSTVEHDPEQSAQAGSEGEGSTTTVQENGRNVPLAALEATRREKQDWKERAIRAEERWKAEEAARQNGQGNGQPAQQEMTPAQALQQQFLEHKFNTSELMARDTYKDASDLEETVNFFADQAKVNPALAMQLNQHPHPWKFAYEEGKKLKLLQEMGSDPAAYKERMRAELLAELGKAPVAQPTSAAAPAAQPLPQSLAGVRSSATRQASTFTGPAPLDTIFAN